jgi:hypothetical protein
MESGRGRFWVGALLGAALTGVVILSMIAPVQATVPFASTCQYGVCPAQGTDPTIPAWLEASLIGIFAALVFVVGALLAINRTRGRRPPTSVGMGSFDEENVAPPQDFGDFGPDDLGR